MTKGFLSLFFVVLAGEAVFMLPFMLPRLYRPLMLEAWGLTNTDFGNAFASYGITAMISYLVGGPFADKYSPRVLLSASLVLTGLGSLYLVQFPSAISLNVTYGFFGVSTIFLMWGALIKTIHIAGGEDQRSLAMGILDSGRGLTAAAFASLLVYAVSVLTPDIKAQAEQIQAVKIIYLLTIAFTLLVSVGIWISLKNFQRSEKNDNHWELQKTIQCLKDSKVWMLSLVILGSYCGYKGIDNYATYLVSVHNVELSRASLLTSILFWFRPVSTLATGFIADRFHRNNKSGRFGILLVLLLLSGASQVLLTFTGENHFYLSFTVVISSATFAYALRALYFSVFGDLKIPPYLVGTTTGIVSFVGFMPDIFFGWVTGRLIDANPGVLGFQYAFTFTAACLFVGAAASLNLYFQNKRDQPPAAGSPLYPADY